MPTTIVRKALAVAITAVASTSAIAADITIRSDEWLPMNGGFTRHAVKGYMIEMAEKIAERSGHAINYRHLAWDASIEAVKAGKFDCLVGATKEEAEGMVISEAEPWGLSQRVAYVHADAKQAPASIDDIKNLRLAKVPDYSYGDELDAWMEEVGELHENVIHIDTVGRVNLIIMSQMVAGKVDVLIDDRNVVSYMTRLVDMEDRIVEAMPIGEAVPIHIACTAANPRGAEYIRMFEGGTRQMRASGELNRILAKYGLRDWSEQPVLTTDTTQPKREQS